MIVESVGKWKRLVADRRLGPYWTPEWASMWSDDPAVLSVTRSAWAVLMRGSDGLVRSPSGDTGIAGFRSGDTKKLIRDVREFGGESYRLKLDAIRGWRILGDQESEPPAVLIDLKTWNRSMLSSGHERHIRAAGQLFKTIVTNRPTDHLIERFAAAYAETEKRRGFDVPLSVAQIERLFARNDAWMSACLDGIELVAGIVFLRAHGVLAYHWGATPDRYLSRHAPAKLAMVQGFGLGCDVLIMGPGAVANDGLQRFKTGFGNARLSHQGVLTGVVK